MAEKQTAAIRTATSELVTITVAPRRTVHLPGRTEEGEPASVAHGPGRTLEVEPAEARRLRDLGFALPEPADDPEA